MVSVIILLKRVNRGARRDASDLWPQCSDRNMGGRISSPATPPVQILPGHWQKSQHA